MFAGVEFAHEADHQQHQTYPEGIHRFAVAGVIVEEGETAGLINRMEQWVPVKHRQHKAWQCIGDEHFTRSNHVCTLVDC